MSLISQQDRRLAIEALQNYKSSFMARDVKMEINALISWLKLEIYKHER